MDEYGNETQQMIGYLKRGLNYGLLRLFQHLLRSASPSKSRFSLNSNINHVSFVCAFTACAKLRLLRLGQALHALALKYENRLKDDPSLHNAISAMYSTCRKPIDAIAVFKTSPRRDLVSWNTLISCYARENDSAEALNSFKALLVEGFRPDIFTLTSFLSACSSSSSAHSLRLGQQVHAFLSKTTALHLHSHISVANALITMYSKSVRVDSARKVFEEMSERNLVTWTAMIAGYSLNARPEDALRMLVGSPGTVCNADGRALVSLLRACAITGYLQLGKQLHAALVKSGCASDLRVCSALLSFYSDSESVRELLQVFAEMEDADTVSWTVLISGFTKRGLWEDALRTLQFMKRIGGPNAREDEYTLSNALSAASCISLAQGLQLHALSVKTGLDRFPVLRNALLSMYSKCGTLEMAVQVSAETPEEERSVVSWNSLMSAYAQHGRAREALRCFEMMQKQENGLLLPDETSVMCVLHACSHRGLVEEGLDYFRIMETRFGIRPSARHLACIVELLGRAGRLEEAKRFAIDASADRDGGVMVLQSLLWVCRNAGDLVWSKRIGRRLLAMDNEGRHEGIRAQVRNMFAEAGDWDKKWELGREDRKEPACSWLEISGRIYAFSTLGFLQSHNIINKSS